MSRATNSKVEEMKEGIARMIQPHAMPGSIEIITLALLELGIERHLRNLLHKREIGARVARRCAQESSRKD